MENGMNNFSGEKNHILPEDDPYNTIVLSGGGINGLTALGAIQYMYDCNKLQNVKIEYLELRNIKNLKISNKLKNSKIFVSFYINNVRLIDNFWNSIKNKPQHLKKKQNLLHQLLLLRKH